MDRSTLALIEGEYQRYKGLAEGTFGQLTLGELVTSPGDGHNSIATLVWHIAGNLESRFTDFLISDGEKPWRDREAEFKPRVVASHTELFARWEEGWSVLLNTLAGLRDRDLTSTVTIRGVEFRVDEALFRSLAHTSYHVGQIVYIGKGLRDVSWANLSIPPGESTAYNANPVLDKAPRPQDGGDGPQP